MGGFTCELQFPYYVVWLVAQLPLKLKGREGRSIYQCFANGTKRILQASLALRLDWYSQELLRTVFTRTISWEEIAVPGRDPPIMRDMNQAEFGRLTQPHTSPPSQPIKSERKEKGDSAYQPGRWAFWNDFHPPRRERGRRWLIFIIFKNESELHLLWYKDIYLTGFLD